MIIMPSTPRLSTPERSTTSSPAAASNSGVEAAITDSVMASSMPMGGPLRGGDEADAMDDQRVAGEHVEQQDALTHLGEVERHMKRDLRALPADEGEREKEPRDQDADRIEAAQERDDDRGEAVARRDARLQVTDRAGHLDDAGKPGERARHREAEQHQPVGIEAGEARRLGGGADHADLEALDGAAEQHARQHHQHQGEERARMQAAALDQRRYGGDGIEFRGGGKIEA